MDSQPQHQHHDAEHDHADCHAAHAWSPVLPNLPNSWKALYKPASAKITRLGTISTMASHTGIPSIIEVSPDWRLEIAPAVVRHATSTATNASSRWAAQSSRALPCGDIHAVKKSTRK